MLPFQLPSIVDEVARQELLVGAFLLATGLMFIFMGVRLSRMLVALSFGIIGFVVGASVPGPSESRLACGLIAAIGLGGASLWMVRPGVAVLAGIWGGLTAMIVMSGCGLTGDVAMVVSAVVFAGCASLAFVSFHKVIAMVTSLEGTLLFIGGFIVMLNQSPAVWIHLRGLLVGNPVFAPFLVLAGTVTGFYLQLTELQKKQTGRSA
jgi:hypothetical protein